MKKYIPFILLTSLLLSACGFNWGEKSDLFQKKQECAKYINILESKAEKEEKELNDRWVIYDETLNRIFYSKKKNTCIALITTHRFVPNPGGEILEYNKENILDIFTNEMDSYSIENTDSMARYYEKINELESN